MTVYYTKRGDGGTSSAMGGDLLYKDDILFDILGDMDELNSCIAVSLQYIRKPEIKKDLHLVQDNLFSISAIVANTYATKNIRMVKAPDAAFLEREIARLGRELPELKKFVIPGGSKASSYLHVARSVARRTERKLVALHKKRKLDSNIIRYANRLSSFLFVLALYLNHASRIRERNPEYL